MAATIPVGGKVPQIFIAHASEDKPQIRELYAKLKAAGYKPWLDEEDLIPGQNWREEIPKALKNSDLFLACLSSTSISKRGYIQREFKMAMEMLAELPPGNIYLIPLKLDDCQIPDLKQLEYRLNLRDIQWLDYYQPNGFEKLIKAIEHQFGNRETMVEKEERTISQNHQGVGDNIPGDKTVNNYYAPNTNSMENKTITSTNKRELLKLLKQITPAQFNELIFSLDVKQEYLPSSDKSQVERAIALLKLAQTPVGMGLEEIQEAIEDLLT